MKSSINPFANGDCTSTFDIGTTTHTTSGSGSLFDDFCAHCHMPTNYVDDVTDVITDQPSGLEHGEVDPNFDPTSSNGTSLAFTTLESQYRNTISGQQWIFCEVCHTNTGSRYTPYHKYQRSGTEYVRRGSATSPATERRATSPGRSRRRASSVRKRGTPAGASVLPADGGIHAVPVPLALQVHYLLDGGVALQYHCPERCPELVAGLESIARPHAEVLVAPYPWMESRLAATAWGRIATFDELDPEAIERFVDTHGGVDHHAEVDPPGSMASH
ncbi:MAG: DUF3105 domain-containing protein [Thermoanaerobaculia bacterium]